MNGKNLSADRLNQNCESAIVTNVIGPLTPGRDEPECRAARQVRYVARPESETMAALSVTT